MNYDDLKSLVYEDLGVQYALLPKAVVEKTIAAMWNRLGGNDPHTAEVDEYNWTIAHPLSCRIQEGGLLACPIGFDWDVFDEPGIYALVDGVWSKTL